MAGRIAAHAEITGSLNQSSAEMMQPEAIDDDTGGKRVPWVGDPPGEGHATLLVRGAFRQRQAGTKPARKPSPAKTA